MPSSDINIGQPPSISIQKNVVSQIGELSIHVWRIFKQVIAWVKGNYCTEQQVREIVVDVLRSGVLLLKQAKEPEFVPEGYVAIYADVDDGNVPKLKYNTGSGEGVVVRIGFQGVNGEQ